MLTRYTTLEGLWHDDVNVGQAGGGRHLHLHIRAEDECAHRGSLADDENPREHHTGRREVDTLLLAVLVDL